MLPDELSDLYQEVILDHYRNPRNAERIEEAELTAHGFNPFCGDEVDLQVHLAEDGAIRSVGFQGRGCSISQASASLLTEALKGKTLEDASEIRNSFRRLMQGEQLSEEELEAIGDLEILSGVRQFPVRIKCALLAFAALEDGISEYRKKHR